jgi:hypothetical protein
MEAAVAASSGDPYGLPLPPATYTIFEEADKAVKDHALAKGYSLVIKKRYVTNLTTRYTYRYGKGKALISQASDNVYKSKRRKTSSQITGYSFSINIKRQDD